MNQNFLGKQFARYDKIFQIPDKLLVKLLQLNNVKIDNNYTVILISNYITILIKIIYYNELISSSAIFFDLPKYFIFFISSKLDLSSPTITKPIIPMPLCGVHQ